MEPDEDGWHAYYPVLVEQGVATWGRIPREVMKNIQEVVGMVIESLLEDDKPIPSEPLEQAHMPDASEMSVTI